MRSKNAFDFSHWNTVISTDASGNLVETPIDWDKVFSTPWNFDFVYTKFAHGTALFGKDTAAYPINLIIKSYLAAKGRLKRGPYHFWYNQYDARLQGKTFRINVGDNIGELRPMADVEDTSFFPQLAWLDTASLNKAQTVSRKVLANLLTYFDEIHNQFQLWPLFYSGGWWWKAVVEDTFVYRDFPGDITPFWEFFTYMAEYDGHLNASVGLQKDLWQTGTKPLPPVLGIPATGGASLDMAKWVSTDAEYELFLNPWGIVPPPPPPPPPVLITWQDELYKWSKTVNPPYAGPKIT